MYLIALICGTMGVVSSGTAPSNKHIRNNNMEHTPAQVSAYLTDSSSEIYKNNIKRGAHDNHTHFSFIVRYWSLHEYFFSESKNCSIDINEFFPWFPRVVESIMSETTVM